MSAIDNLFFILKMSSFHIYFKNDLIEYRIEYRILLDVLFCLFNFLKI